MERRLGKRYPCNEKKGELEIILSFFIFRINLYKSEEISRFFFISLYILLKNESS